MHVWVDPQYGNDSSAAALNPHSGINPADACDNVTPAPNPMAVDPDPSFGLLYHAPYPFRTVTAAVNYINSVFPSGLPYANGLVGTSPQLYTVTVSHVIIHCLPGKYAREVQQGGTLSFQDAHNLLYPNGEVFPIDLPNRVCVQGTSAMNTVFCLEQDSQQGAREVGSGPAFRFGVSSDSRGVETTIDSISIYGAPTDGVVETRSEPFSAIALTNDFASSPTITNCFIFGNGIGMFVDAPVEAEEFHTPTLVNNTFCENTVGIWNGQWDLGNSSQGVSELLLINNILDAKLRHWDRTSGALGNWEDTLPPYMQTNYGGNPFGGSAFEGIDAGDLRISNAAFTSPAQGDFNAYPANGIGRDNFDRQIAWPSLNLPITTEVGATPAPLVNLRAIAGVQGANDNRGVLYVRDLMLNAPFDATSKFINYGLPAATVGVFGDVFCRNAMDFRLSPDASLATANATPYRLSDQSGGNAFRNPCVDRGYDGPFPVTMVNGRVLTYRPGQKWCVGGQCVAHSWTFSSWDTDCEGFGNARIFDHPIYTVTNPATQIQGAEGVIDIGADELGTHIVCGYRFGTTAFIHLENPLFGPPTGQTHNNRFVWFLGPSNIGGSTNSGEYASYGDGYPYTLDPGVTLPHEDSWDPADNSFYKPTIVQTSPHLLPDIHPWWGLWLGGDPSNPDWHHNGCATPGAPYNPALFNAPTVGHINPQGSTDNTATPANFYWLEEQDYLGNPLANKALTVGTGASDNFDPPGGSLLSPGQIFFFGDWCENGLLGATSHTAHETWKQTSPNQADIFGLAEGPFIIRRYSTERDISTGPILGSGPTASNLQSFWVLVEAEE